MEPIGDGKFRTKGDDSDELIKCYETFFGDGIDERNEGLALMKTQHAARVEQRLQGTVCFRFAICLSLLNQGDKIGLSGFQIDFVYREHGGDDWVVYDEAVKEKTGVSLLHVLEVLQGNDDNMDPPNPDQLSLQYVNADDEIVSLT